MCCKNSYKARIIAPSVYGMMPKEVDVLNTLVKFCRFIL